LQPSASAKRVPNYCAAAQPGSHCPPPQSALSYGDLIRP
jgi:hypothetical protein